MKLPSTVKAFTKEMPDGSYTVLINDDLSREEKVSAYMHEIGHIYRCDFEKESVDEIERSIRCM